ncbi:hypothetical protein LCGC14_0709110 [marine sediment metagenome]|uniref:Uncharacterized protein n=1 Tax=marine sediment metagenome TaxID=412755 RepID=A0A0F9QFM4_9ZZZZ
MGSISEIELVTDKVLSPKIIRRKTIAKAKNFNKKPPK